MYFSVWKKTSKQINLYLWARFEFLELNSWSEKLKPALACCTFVSKSSFNVCWQFYVFFFAFCLMCQKQLGDFAKYFRFYGCNWCQIVTRLVILVQWKDAKDWRFFMMKAFFFFEQKLRTHRCLKTYCATLVMKMKWKMISFFFSFFKVMEHRWNEIDTGKPKYSDKNLSSATSSTTNPTWTDSGSDLGLRGGRWWRR
jgi:hypothetical protein